MRQLLDLLHRKPRPPELGRLVCRYIHCRRGFLWKVNPLLQHVERTWEKVSSDPNDPTNNVTERLIGLTFKIRAKTLRGFKAQKKAIDPIYLASFLRGTNDPCNLKSLI